MQDVSNIALIKKQKQKPQKSNSTTCKPQIPNSKVEKARIENPKIGRSRTPNPKTRNQSKKRKLNSQTQKIIPKREINPNLKS